MKNIDIRSPFCIMIRHFGNLSPQEIFEFLNIKILSQLENVEQGMNELIQKRIIFTAQDNKWFHILDRCYSL
ncbi:hypothetical protein [Candidatus Uabimicrobium sp. HlEnr_7]|uniref:hypothetical protein n=1 Tax=Candidatus Uabimicrobium helgolandensis TaxID=3095367 RepID=UPI0035571028